MGKSSKKSDKKKKRKLVEVDGSSPTSTKETLTSTENAENSNDNNDNNEKNNVSLCLFYQYVEPVWLEEEFEEALKYCQACGDELNVTGRMRVAREGLNCTITGDYHNLRKWTEKMIEWKPEVFGKTDFKFTDNLPSGQRFPNLKVFEVVEIVNYGLAGHRAPSIEKYGGTHLEPKEYHQKMEEKDTVIIDVRNHYEAIIGRFDPPKGGAEWIDPNMRKSTEFPVWLDKPETKEKLRGKTVLTYCTGGIRCERASALIRQRLETDDEMKSLGVKGVYQLQGGVDKYFKAFEDGGHWKGKNYVFDKRFSHAPPKADTSNPLSKCEKCQTPWDRFRNKRRCPTCGVPSLICKECFDADPKISKDKTVRCDLCVQQNIKSKSQWRSIEREDLAQYEAKFTNTEPPHKKQKKEITRKTKPAPNPEGITRLFLGNLCTKSMNEDILCEFIPGITHVMWITDRKTGKFFGKCFVEMTTSDDAAYAVGKNGMKLLGRPIKAQYQKADPKDLWPHPNCKLDKK